MAGEFERAFLARVFSARERAGLTQDQIAKALHIEQYTYAKYETRTLMPHRHMETFCIVCHVSVEWLVTGQGKGVRLMERPPATKRRGRKKKPSVAA